MLPHRSKCLFLAVPDIVGNAIDTLEAYTEFERYFAAWPLAYVAQNGAEDLPIPVNLVLSLLVMVLTIDE